MIRERNAFVLWLCILLVVVTVGACGSPASTDTPPPDEPPVPASDTLGEATPVLPLPPAVSPDEIEAAQQHRDTTITYYGDSVGQGSRIDNLLAEQFTQDTGIVVEIVPRSQDATASYEQYQQFLQNQSPDFDVLSLDTIWIGAFAPHLIDLGPAFEDRVGDYYESSIANNTVDGRLVAMPWFADIGMLYYRTDLLEAYGFDGPPTTWDELETMARTIQEGERTSGNTSFVGFVFQGNAYEGLTCNAMEWIASQGGGVLVDDGGSTLDNPQAVAALERASLWVGTIAPDDVVSFKEEDGRQMFQAGNAAFMRNWPYAYAAMIEDDAPITESFDVAPLPRAADGQHVGMVGGWQLGVPVYSQHQEAAIMFVRYLTSAEVQRWRALVGSYPPTIPAVAEDPEVMDALPFLENLSGVQRIYRPSQALGVHYPEASNVFFYGVYEILIGGEAITIVPTMDERIQAIVEEASAE